MLEALSAHLLIAFVESSEECGELVKIGAELCECCRSDGVCAGRIDSDHVFVVSLIITVHYPSIAMNTVGDADQQLNATEA